MIFMLNIILVLLRVSIISAEYNYKNPDTWKEDYSKCGGSEQSPIDIGGDYHMERNFRRIANRIRVENYQTVPAKMTMKNNGHTLKVMLEWANGETKIPHLIGGPLEAEYDLHSLEFHWGPDSDSGSEHKFRGKSYPIELQLIHYDNEFDNIEDAESYERGLLIYSTFFEEESEESGFLTKVIEKLSDIVEPETETEIEPFPIDDLLHEKEAEIFIKYHGSLTSPPCSESVTWLISDQVFSATKEQLQAFHTIHLLDGDDHNNRPVQELNDRLPTLHAKDNVANT